MAEKSGFVPKKKKISFFFFRDITLSVTGQRSAVVRRPSILQAPTTPSARKWCIKNAVLGD